MDIKLKNTDIDLREEISILEKDYGYEVVLVRPSKMQCTCVAQQGQQAAPFCPKCLGLGRRIRLEKIKVVAREALMVNATQVSTQYTELGNMYTNTRVFYIKYNIHPPVNSYIYHVSWNNDKPCTILGMYKIRYSESIRGDNGRTEYYLCSGYRDTSSVTQKEEVLKNFKIY